ncbi:hypothetical protein, partial [Segatella copri]|uniref:hypothetical protein n=1 Tax=Segatella copri TaxID=165179 RepID=UPI001F3C28E8
FLGYAAAVDVAFTILMFFMFAGSFSGIVAAAFAGLFMTVMLHILRQTIGYDKLKFVRWYKVAWVHTQGKVEKFAW